ncbi:MAG: CAP-associated domain-containing protein [Bacillota bacterium]|uniref:CAP domain-containing protein n=1 Tax=Virgibacillus salarius TaxID=447199 RepID=UPI0004025BB6|nr:MULTISPECIES: CAP domain-containing protein [Bacillaceae]WBX79670.1 CAP domain-containing protein [Virgibacillus salarius]
MRFIKSIILLSLLAVVGFYFLEQNDMSPEATIESISDSVKEKQQLLKTKVVPEKKEEIPLAGELFQWFGKSTDALIQSMGKPTRKDPSAYGYTWWVYTDQKETYVQFGVADDKIQTIYATGNNINIKPVTLGESYENISKQFNFSDEVTYRNGLTSYTFKLKDEDKKMRPLVKLSDSVFMQLYFDTFTNTLSSVRVLEAETLLKHQPYELQYRGNLPEQPDLTNEQWAKVEEGMEQQIFDITNVMRHKQGKTTLKWEKSVGEVAFLHSKDMSDNNYFSHSSLDGRGLKDRLDEGKVSFVSAGENIAAQYPDAAAAMEGWLNSEGHRKALLSDDYTHLGVGVYRLYYTQNFLAKAF